MAEWVDNSSILDASQQQLLAVIKPQLGDDGYRMLVDIVLWAQVWQDAFKGKARTDDIAINVAMLPFFGSFGAIDTWTVVRPQVVPIIMQIAVQWVVANKRGADFNLSTIVLHQVSVQVATALHGVVKAAEMQQTIDAVHKAGAG